MRPLVLTSWRHRGNTLTLEQDHCGFSIVLNTVELAESDTYLMAAGEFEFQKSKIQRRLAT